LTENNLYFPRTIKTNILCNLSFSYFLVPPAQEKNGVGEKISGGGKGKTIDEEVVYR